MTTEALEALGDTLNFIEIWIKLLDQNYEVRCGMYNIAMKDIFKWMPTKMTKPLSPKQKVQKLMIEIGGRWYMGKLLRGYHQ